MIDSIGNHGVKAQVAWGKSMSRQLSEAKRYQMKNQAGDWAFISVTTPVSVQQMRDLIGLSNTLLGVGNKPTDDKPQATPESTERA